MMQEGAFGGGWHDVQSKIALKMYTEWKVLDSEKYENAISSFAICKVSKTKDEKNLLAFEYCLGGVRILQVVDAREGPSFYRSLLCLQCRYCKAHLLLAGHQSTRNHILSVDLLYLSPSSFSFFSKKTCKPRENRSIYSLTLLLDSGLVVNDSISNPCWIDSFKRNLHLISSSEQIPIFAAMVGLYLH